MDRETLEISKQTQKDNGDPYRVQWDYGRLAEGEKTMEGGLRG